MKAANLLQEVPFWTGSIS